MIDMGRKQEAPTAIEGKQESKITYPSFSLVGDKIPEELKDAKLETMCRCEIIIKKIGDDIDTYATGQPRRVQVEIHKLGYKAGAGKLNREEYIKKSPKEREEYDKDDLKIEEEKKEE